MAEKLEKFFLRPSDSFVLSTSMASSSSPTPAGPEIDYEQIPVLALNWGVRKRLGLYLNPSSMVASDWTDLAEKMGFSYLEIKNFEKRENPTQTLLEDWQTRPGATVGRLLAFLREAERKDIITDLKHLIGRSWTTSTTLLRIFVYSGSRFLHVDKVLG